LSDDRILRSDIGEDHVFWISEAKGMDQHEEKCERRFLPGPSAATTYFQPYKS
jgi:hypothetical protein